MYLPVEAGFWYFAGMIKHVQDDVSNEWKGILFALVAVVLWSGNFIVARAAHQFITPVSLAFYRWLMATLILLPFAIVPLKREYRLVLQHWKYFCFVGLTGITLFNTLIYVAAHSTSATNLALIGTTASPVFVLLISAMVLKQHLRWNQFAGALICIAGILILISKGDMEKIVHFRFATGDLWIIAAALSFAVYTVLVRRKPASVSSMTFLFSAFLLGTIFLIPAFITDRLSRFSMQWSEPMIYVIIYLGLGASVISFLCWNRAVKLLGAPRTALFGNLIPAFSIAEAAFFLGETFTVIAGISIAVIAAGVVLANINFHK